MNDDRALTVAVTGINAAPENPGPGLAVVRCLREAYGNRVRVIGLAYDAFDPGLYLNGYCDATYLIAYPFNGAEAMVSRLTEINLAEQIDVLIPCLDAELPLMVRLASQLESLHIRTFLPDADQLARRAKDRLPELARIAQVPYPETRLLSEPGFFYRCHLEGWSYPLVVKGVFYDAITVANADEAAAAFRQIALQWGLPVLAQRFVSGEEYNLTAVGDGQGNLLGEVMMKKRAVTSKGKAWAGVTTHDETLAAAARKLAMALQWKGPIEVEMMRVDNGDYHLIEINPRFPAWIYLSHGVGRNLPALLLELALGHDAPALAPLEAGTIFIRYAQETIVPLAAFEAVMIGGRYPPGSGG